MPNAEKIAYKRERFSTRLPSDYTYTPSHYWLCEQEPGRWRIGMTKFAARMLGEIVEYDFECIKDVAMESGSVIGWIEGFKATSDLFAVVDGTFLGENPALNDDPALAHSKPYGDGWLYEMKGVPGTNSIDVQAYIEHLDVCIDRIQASYT